MVTAKIRFSARISGSVNDFFQRPAASAYPDPMSHPAHYGLHAPPALPSVPAQVRYLTIWRTGLVEGDLVSWGSIRRPQAPP